MGLFDFSTNEHYRRAMNILPYLALDRRDVKPAGIAKRAALRPKVHAIYLPARMHNFVKPTLPAKSSAKTVEYRPATHSVAFPGATRQLLVRILCVEMLWPNLRICQATKG